MKPQAVRTYDKVTQRRIQGASGPKAIGMARQLWLGGRTGSLGFKIHPLDSLGLKADCMSEPSSSPSLFGFSYGWSYALAAFTMTVTCCLPLALLATMQHTGTGAERANALIAWLPVMAGLVAVASVLLYVGKVRHTVHWQRSALMVMWALSALGMVGWWKL